MTKEEAIYQLNAFVGDMQMPSEEAVNMAIEALKQAEHITCENCKHFDACKNGTNGICKYHDVPMYSYDFCSCAEEREDDKRASD